MRRRIFLVVMAATSLVVVAFVLPLLLTIRTLAEEQAMADADHQVGNVGALAASGVEARKLGRILDSINSEGSVQISVLLPTGSVVGAEGMSPEDPDVQFALNQRRSGSVVDERGGQVFLTVVDNDDVTVIRGSLTPEQLREGVHRTWLQIIGLGVALLIIAASMALQLGRRASEQLTEVAEVATRLRAGDFTSRAEVSGTTETVELARALNDMADRHSERIESERTALALSHRLRTVLAGMRVDAESVGDQQLRDRLLESIGMLGRSTDAVSRQGLRAAAVHTSPTSDAVEVVDERARFWQRLATAEQRTMEVSLPDTPLHVALPADRLADLIDVLVDNVFVHTPSGTSFAIEVTAEPDHVLVVVSDSGSGTETYAPAVRGAGNGLDIAQQTAREIGGELKVRWSSPQGTEVAATLPLTDPPSVEPI